MGEFYAGVIEGFYGPPWSLAERLELFGWMQGWGLNTYLYAPKDDLKHRARWRELYSEAEAAALRRVIEGCEARQIRFVYALGPGLDIRFSEPAETERLIARFQQMMDLGCAHFALSFDDIPDRMSGADAARFGSFAAAQSAVTNEVFRWTRDSGCTGLFYFCPTPYCGRMAERKLGGEGYLEIIGERLAPEIDVFWTGPEIVSESISVAHVGEIAALLRRPPVIWDNLHANDYDGRRMYCGPCDGRPPELRGAVRGILSNPNTEFPLNFVPLKTLGDFARAGDTWNAREAYLSALGEWAGRFVTSRKESADDLALFGDCYYLPHREGPEAESFFREARAMIHQPERAAAFRERAMRLREFCARLAELQDRPLFYALSRRVWELREEIDLLERFATHLIEHRTEPFASDFHLPRTYRGGFVPRLQRLLEPQADGTFRPNAFSP